MFSENIKSSSADKGLVRGLGHYCIIDPQYSSLSRLILWYFAFFACLVRNISQNYVKLCFCSSVSFQKNMYFFVVKKVVNGNSKDWRQWKICKEMISKRGEAAAAAAAIWWHRPFGGSTGRTLTTMPRFQEKETFQHSQDMFTEWKSEFA